MEFIVRSLERREQVLNKVKRIAED